MHKTTIIYARVMTCTKALVEHQINTLREVALGRGWTIAAVVVEDAGLDQRRYPGIERIMKRIATQADVGTLMLPSLTCIGSKVDHLLTFLMEMHAANVGIYADEECIDTNADDGGTFLGTMGLLDAYRAHLRRERVRAGRLRALQSGTVYGRKPIPDAKLASVRQSLQAGAGIRPTARATGVSPAKVYEIKRQMAAGAQVSADPVAG